MTFLAGESIGTARSEPTDDDLTREALDGCYWWSSLEWFIRCDACGTVTQYHRPDDLTRTNDRRRWETAWIAWTAHGGGSHRCADGCQATLF